MDITIDLVGADLTKLAFSMFNISLLARNHFDILLRTNYLFIDLNMASEACDVCPLNDRYAGCEV